MSVNRHPCAGNEPSSVANAGICPHSGGTDAVPVTDFEEKLQVWYSSTSGVHFAQLYMLAIHF